ncbi:F-box protein PP2-A12 [Striga hermonthica]|uniref:F-box protein PP2-A12 n=1 Tax=Striga hermonthica TaxID=68872 RepID=A0A9N7P3Z1_STRHE|nr:F-box protein PP2-A12 [Striga hermonthica]
MICRLAGLNQAFRAASSADFVWDSKLPSNYEDVIGAVFGEKDIFPKGFCKKDIYALLCRANTLDGGTKKVWLDKRTGKTCMLISYNGLAITGIDDRRYWTRVTTEESRFRSMAYLQQIWWLEVYGEVEFPFPVGSYSLFFRLKLGREIMRFGRRLCPGKWILYHVGDFVVENSHKSTRVKFWMTQIDCTHTKGGLCVDSVVVCPVGRKRVGRF